jgi:hAT family C-terminal dimerisation region
LKAFKEFAKVESEDDCEDDNTIEFVSLDGALASTHGEADDEPEFYLPPHQRCLSHTLSLIATTDIKHTNFRGEFKKVYTSAFSKCFGFWNLISRSTKASDIVETHSKNAFRTPVPTRWNSLFDSLESLLTRKEKLPKIFSDLGLPELRETEIVLLEEYTSCLKPLAIALDRLQGEHNTFQGEIIPLLLSTKLKLENLQNVNFKYCGPLIIAMLAGLSKRFPSFLNLSADVNESIVASVCHPLFKMRWVPRDKNKDEIRNIFLNAADKMFARSSRSAQNINSNNIAEDDDIFEFECQNQQSNEPETTTANKIQLECLQYLDDDTSKDAKNISMLHRYPIVKELFIKFNCPLPSSAPVERLFSFAGMILNPKRRCLTDSNFEKLLLLQANPFKK